ncbi:VOC family protein [Paenibacillus azoreducens]|uniref:VOC family protein n=1 Tax=Paenibacillus azoreducens TaxID=116718 RepID=UPI0039F63AE5
MKLEEVILQTNQPDAIKRFYGTLLGLDVYEDSLSGISFRTGSSRLSFTKAYAEEKAYYHIAFAIPSNKSEEAKQWVKEKGVALYSKDGKDEFFFENWNATAFYFYDPDGNLIEFIAHHMVDYAVDERFGPEHLLRISEIGLPVEDVPEAVRNLIGTFQLNEWGGDGQQFAPLGDAGGALIVVNKNRPWFPDGRLPGTFATNVVISHSDSAHLRLQNDLYQLSSSKK